MEHLHSHHSAHGTYISYTIGFVLSIALTLSAFGLVVSNTLPSHIEIFAVIILALAQLATQLFFFLHLGRESRPRWNSLVFYFALLIVLIVVIGSLWIMQNLDYNMNTMTPQQMDAYMIDQ